MIGILTEKPSAMKNFAKALGGNKGTYNGEMYVLTSSVGHLYGFVPPEKQVDACLAEKYHSWKIEFLPWNEADFSWKRGIIKGKNDVVKKIKGDLSACDEIVIATDVDPTGEGELLAWEILDELKLHNKKVSRMYFLDESVKEIQKAFVNRKALVGMWQDADFLKAYYRTKWDFLSMQFTRIATFYGDEKSVLRQGRLKSAMVRITGDGLKAVKEYKKIPYYQNRFKDENGNIFVNKEEPQFKESGQVPRIYTSSPVTIDSRERKKTSPPKLLDLAALSSRLSPSGLKAKTVLSIYQKMYEDQVVSYPRTEDKFISPEQFNELLPLVDRIAAVVGVDASLLTHRTPRSTHVKTGGAHGANRPGTNVPNNLSDLDSKYGKGAAAIYSILAKNYLAILAEDYEFEHQTGHLEKYPLFKGYSNIPLKQGFKAVFSDDNDKEKDDADSGKGLGKLAHPFVYEGFPTKPPTPTMKWLMKQLEKHDVGTGATRTTIYSDVTNDKTKFPLMVDKKGKLSFTQYGDMSYLLLKDTYIGDVKITESLMSEMRDIAAGKLSSDTALKRMQDLVKHDIEVFKNNSGSMRKEMRVMPQQEKQVQKVSGIWQQTGSEVTFSREWGGHVFTDEEVNDLLAGKEITISGLKSAKGTEYGVIGRLANLSYNGISYVGFDKIAFTGEAKDDSERYGGVWNGRNVSFKRVFRGYSLSDEECEKLLSGAEIPIMGLKSSKNPGKTYGIKARLADLSYQGKSYVGIEQVGFLNEGDGIPQSWCGHKFTSIEREELLNGSSIYLDDCVSKKSGRNFSCNLSLVTSPDGSKALVPKYD